MPPGHLDATGMSFEVLGSRAELQHRRPWHGARSSARARVRSGSGRQRAAAAWWRARVSGGATSDGPPLMVNPPDCLRCPVVAVPARPRCHLALSASESVSGGSGGGTRLQDTDSGKSYARKPASVQIHVHEAELSEARGEQSVRRLQHDGFVQVKGEEVEAAPSCDAFGQTAASSEFRLRRLVCQSMCSSRLERGPS